MNNLLQNIIMSKNPQQMAMNILKQNYMNNPIMHNVYDMANSNNAQGIEQIARNLCKEKGIDADALMNNIRTFR